jgi:hypothetical protein
MANGTLATVVLINRYGGHAFFPHFTVSPAFANGSLLWSWE